MTDPHPTERVPCPGPLCRTAPKMNDTRNTNALAMVSSAVVRKPKGALRAGNIRAFREEMQPMTSPV